MEHKLNVLLINGSPNAKGCTYTALSEVERTLNAEGIASELVHIGNRDIRGCIACYKCAEQGHCVFNDAVNELAPKFEAADGLVVGSPTYYAGPNGTLTNLLDRLFFSTHFSKRMKVGAASCTSRRVTSTLPSSVSSPSTTAAAPSSLQRLMVAIISICSNSE